VPPWHLASATIAFGGTQTACWIRQLTLKDIKSLPHISHTFHPWRYADPDPLPHFHILIPSPTNTQFPFSYYSLAIDYIPHFGIIK
jgi:hypothetical protein